MRRFFLMLSLFTGLALLAAPRARADWTASGDVQYTDREYDLHGYTGNWVPKPIRFARVQVVDANSSEILATGSTDNNGHFVIRVADTKVRDVYATVFAAGGDTTVYPGYVADPERGFVAHSISTPVLTSHGPNTDYALPGIMRAGADASSEAFNIFDCIVNAFDYASAVTGGGRPTRTLVCYWGPKLSLSHAPYGTAWGVLVDSGRGWDDPETYRRIGGGIGGALTQPGSSTDSSTPLQAAWLGGWRMFFAQSLADYLGQSSPSRFVPLPSDSGRYGDLGPVDLLAPPITGGGDVDSFAVAGTLWSIAHGGAGLSAAEGQRAIWDVLTTRMYLDWESQTFEDFWIGWQVRGWGHADEFGQVMQTFEIPFNADSYEPDDLPSTATSLPATGLLTHHSFFPANDVDWYRLEGTPGQSVAVQADHFGGGTGVLLVAYGPPDMQLLYSSSSTDRDNATTNLIATFDSYAPIYVRASGRASNFGTYDLRAWAVGGAAGGNLVTRVPLRNDPAYRYSGRVAFVGDGSGSTVNSRLAFPRDTLRMRLDILRESTGGDTSVAGQVQGFWDNPFLLASTRDGRIYGICPNYNFASDTATAALLFVCLPSGETRILHRFAARDLNDFHGTLATWPDQSVSGLMHGHGETRFTVFRADTSGAYQTIYALPDTSTPAGGISISPDGTLGLVEQGSTYTESGMVHCRYVSIRQDGALSAVPIETLGYWTTNVVFGPGGSAFAVRRDSLFRLDTPGTIRPMCGMRAGDLDEYSLRFGSDGRIYYLAGNYSGLYVSDTLGHFAQVVDGAPVTNGSHASVEAFDFANNGDVFYARSYVGANWLAEIYRIPNLIGADGPMALVGPSARVNHGLPELRWGTAMDSYVEHRVLRSEDGQPERVLADFDAAGIPGPAFLDSTARAGVEYTYRVACRLNALSPWQYSAPVRLLATGPAFSLGLPHPNPTRGLSRMSFELPRAGHVRLDVYDVLGRRVRTVLDRTLPAGPGSASWDGLNRNGDQVPSGVYFARLALDTQSVTHKLLVIR